MRRFLIATVLFLVTLPLFAQQQPPPDATWDTMMRGNAAFMTGSVTTNVGNRLPGAQVPRVTVLSCADSRVPPELIFNQTIGQLFIVRTAGNIASDLDIASIEYAISKGWTRTIVVLGHQNCGAVMAAMNTADPGTPTLDALVQRIRESFVGFAPWNTEEPTMVRRATDANTRNSAAWLLAHSALIRSRATAATNPIVIIPAYYNLTTGQVEKIN
jgi:carbonic anhydrase